MFGGLKYDYHKARRRPLEVRKDLTTAQRVVGLLTYKACKEASRTS